MSILMLVGGMLLIEICAAVEDASEGSGEKSTAAEKAAATNAAGAFGRSTAAGGFWGCCGWKAVANERSERMWILILNLFRMSCERLQVGLAMRQQ